MSNASHAKVTPRAVLYMFSLTTWLVVPAVAAPQANIEQQKAQADVQSTTRKQPVVRGRVIYEDTRRPLRRVQVMLYDPAAQGRGRHLMAWTNGRGEFLVRNVPFGKYFITVDAPGIIRSGPFFSEDAQTDLTSVSVNGSTPSEVVVRVKRGSAISGKVTYADGDPVVNASITPLLKKDGKWVPVYVGGPSTDRVLTDERGFYRLSGLLPGEYLVGAAEQKMTTEFTEDDDGGNMLNRGLLQATYYDGATSLNNATVLQLGAGDEQTGINITLVERTVRTIAGVVMLEDNRPVRNARISLKRKDQEFANSFVSEQHVVNTDEEGQFILDEVYEGTYTLTVAPPERYRFYANQSRSETKVKLPKKFVAKHVELNIAGSDLTNLIIEVANGQLMTGFVTVDGGKTLPRTDIFVVLEPAGEERRDEIQSTITGRDGTFTLEGIPPGRYHLRTSVQNSAYYTKSVMHGRSDITSEPLTIKEGEDIGDVRITISPDVATLSGRVLASDGKTPQAGVNILFVSADSVEKKSMIRRMFGVTNADGSFRVSGAPGEYLAIVFRLNEQIFQLNRDELFSRAAKAKRLTVQAGENKSIDLVIPNESKNP